MSYNALLLLSGIATIAYMSNKVNMSKGKQSLGVRNNNPGNLVLTNIQWYGKIPNDKNNDGRYEQFTSAHWGLRAMAMDIRNDMEKDGLNTVEKLITEYAPKSDNNPTASYINFVSKAIKKRKDDAINRNDLFGLMNSIIQFENGSNPYTTTQVMMAINDSFVSK